MKAMVDAHDHADLGPEELELRQLFNEWDPIGVYHFDEDDDLPPDEYDCQIGPLLSALRAGHDAQRIADSLRLQLKNHFGLDPANSNPEAFAERLLNWWQNRP